jgi:hypothetical protein
MEETVVSDENKTFDLSTKSNNNNNINCNTIIGSPLLAPNEVEGDDMNQYQLPMVQTLNKEELELEILQRAWS